MHPSQQEGHIDIALQNFSVAFQNPPKGYIAPFLAPRFLQKNSTDKYYIINPKTFYQRDDDLVAEDGVATEIDWNYTTETFSMVNHSKRRFVSDKRENKADPAVKPSKMAVKLLVSRANLNWEKDVIDLFTDSAQYAAGHTSAIAAGSRWDEANGNPIADSRAARRATLFPGDPSARFCLFIGQDAFDALEVNPRLLEMYKYTSGGTVSYEEIKKALKVDEIYISELKLDANDADDADLDAQYYFPKSAIFAWCIQTPSEEIANLGWTFWYDDQDAVESIVSGGNAFFPVRKYREPARARGGFYYEVWVEYKPAIISTFVAYLYTTVIN